MFSRLVYAFVLGLLMYRPRPIATTPGPSTPPPGVDPDDFPDDTDRPGGHGPIDIDLDPIEVGSIHPDHPPTAPPGYEGEWPPKSTTGGGGRPTPPEGPPGHEGTWPPRRITRPGLIDHRPFLFDRVRELIDSARQIDPRILLMRSGSSSSQAETGAQDF